MSDDVTRSGARSLPPKIRRAVEAGDLPPGAELGDLRMVERQGELAGRAVTYFRVYDARKATDQGVAVQTFDDLDDHLDVVLRAGHTEADGSVEMGHGWPVGVRKRPVLPE